MVQLALFITGIVSLLLGILVFLNNPRSTVFRIYLVFSLFAALWMTVNGLAVNDPISLTPRELLWFSQCITPLSLFTSLAFYLFLRRFIHTPRRLLNHWTIVPTVIISLFSFSSYNVYLDNHGNPMLGGLYYPYLLALLFNVFLVFHTLYSKASASFMRTGAQRVQLSYLRIGAFATIMPAIGLGSILPLFNDGPLSDLGPLFAVFFLLFAGIAIVRHRLFDIRTYVVRALFYLLTFLAIGMVYVSPLVYLLGRFMLKIPVHLVQFVFTVIFLTFVAMFFNSVRRWFDRTTSRIFFKDMYDPALVLADLNKALVTTIELDKMLALGSRIVADTFKADYCVFVLKDKTGTEWRAVGTGSQRVSYTELTSVDEIMQAGSSNIALTAMLEQEQKGLQTIMSHNAAAVLIRLSSAGVNRRGSLGYMLLGFKKSGNTYTKDDVDTLETMADALTLAIQNALRFEEIQDFNLTLQQRIYDATAQLRRTNAKLKALDETKDDFISMASHQLRTPLTSVKGYLSMVLEGDAGKITPMQRKMLDQAFVSSQRMVFLIADLLNVSRLKTGKFVIEPSPVNLAKTVTDEIEQLKETAKNRELHLVYDRPADFPTLMIDETKIRQVIMNFIDNAIYYTPKGGTIRVELKDTPATVELRVVDNGIGVPKREQPHLFTKFYRAGNARQTRPDGTGLGLFMAKKVVVAQGGAVIFDSTEGKGSTFGFVFPKVKLMATPPAPQAQVLPH